MQIHRVEVGDYSFMSVATPSAFTPLNERGPGHIQLLRLPRREKLAHGAAYMCFFLRLALQRRMHQRLWSTQKDCGRGEAGVVSANKQAN